MKSQGKQLHILFVITQGSWGGAQRTVFDLAKAFSPSATITVAIGEKKGKKDLQEALQGISPSLQVIQLQHLKRAISPLQDILAVRELRQLYQKFQPDIIHLHSTKAGILGSLASHKKWKTIYTVHGWVFLEPLSPIIKKLYSWLEKITLSFKDAFILLSEKEKEIALRKFHISPSKIHIIPPGIEPISFLPKEKARSNIQKNLSVTPSHWVGTIAGLYKTKGIDFLIDMVSTHEKNLPPGTVFVIIGDGPEKETLEKKIQASGLQKKIFLIGQKKNAAQLLPAFDLFLLPSYKEGLPYTLLEAMQAKLPIIATRVGGIEALLSSYSPKQIINAGDQESLFAAIKKFLSHPPLAGHPVSVHGLEEMITSTSKLYSSLGPDSKHY